MILLLAVPSSPSLRLLFSVWPIKSLEGACTRGIESCACDHILPMKLNYRCHFDKAQPSDSKWRNYQSYFSYTNIHKHTERESAREKTIERKIRNQNGDGEEGHGIPYLPLHKAGKGKPSSSTWRLHLPRCSLSSTMTLYKTESRKSSIKAIDICFLPLSAAGEPDINYSLCYRFPRATAMAVWLQLERINAQPGKIKKERKE